jgi:hypothetical protein
MIYASWAFASLIIVIRTQVILWNLPLDDSQFSFIFRIAIWNRDVIVSLIAVGVWLCGVALNTWGTFYVIY